MERKSSHLSCALCQGTQNINTSDVTRVSNLVFSVGECMLNDRWSNIHLNIVETIVCMKDCVIVEFKSQNRIVKDIFKDFKNLDVEDE